jgi:hypothetical protein
MITKEEIKELLALSSLETVDEQREMPLVGRCAASGRTVGLIETAEDADRLDIKILPAGEMVLVHSDASFKAWVEEGWLL